MKEEICIFTTSDIHGRLLPKDKRPNDGSPAPCHSLAQIATLLKERRKTCAHSIYFDNGDTIQGSSLVHFFGKYADGKEHPVVRGLQEMDCDALVIGNHEFNYGVETLLSLSRSSPFPFLSGNIRDARTGTAYFGLPYRIVQRGPLSVALVGLTTRVVERGSEQVVLTDEVQALKDCLKSIREQQPVDLVVVGYHGGTDRDMDTGEPIAKPFENRGIELMEQVEGIDVLVTGHQHRTFTWIQGTQTMIQPGAFADGLGEVRLELEQDSPGERWKVVNAEATVWSNEKLEPDRGFVDAMEPFVRKARRWEQEALSELKKSYPVNDILSEICMEEHPLVQWMHDVQMRASEAPLSAVSYVNEQFKGFVDPRVTREDVMQFFPYPDGLQVMELSGRHVMALMEVSATLFDLNGHQAFPVVNREWLRPHFRIYDYVMWKGLDYRLDLRNPPGQRLTECRTKEGPVDPDGRYQVVTTAFIANQMRSVLDGFDGQVVSNIEREVPDLLMEDAQRGGLEAVAVTRNRSVIY